MKRKLIVYGLVALLFLGLGAFFGSRSLAPTPASAVPASAVAQLLALSLPDVQGQPQALSKWRGKALIVNFWAPWCPPCVKEMPELSALHTELAAKDIHVLGIGIDSAANIAEFSSKYKISFPLYVAGLSGTELGRQLGNQAGGLPFTVLIGADGKVKKTYLGSLKFDQLRTDLAAL